MHFIDYTHPHIVPNLHLEHDRRSSKYYLRLDDLPKGHPYHMRDWAIFRYSLWLEGGSAWVQAKAIVEDVEDFVRVKDLRGEIRPVVGSGDPEFDEALAQAILTFGYSPLVAEIVPKINSTQEDQQD